MDDKIRKNADWLREFILKPASWFVVGFSIASLATYLIFLANQDLKKSLEHEKEEAEREFATERALRLQTEKEKKEWQDLYYVSSDSCAAKTLRTYQLMQSLINNSNRKINTQIQKENKTLKEVKKTTDELKKIIQ